VPMADKRTAIDVKNLRLTGDEFIEIEDIEE
jgi:hypothetical protein